MAAWVTLKNGKVLKYNDCRFVDPNLNKSILVLREEKDGIVIALIPLDSVERFEYFRPCRTYREPRKDKLPILK